MAKRRVKTFKGQKETLPIKDKKLLNSFMNNLLLKRDLAKTDIKRYQADRNYMIALLGFNTAFRANDLLQLRVIDVKKDTFISKSLKRAKCNIIVWIKGFTRTFWITLKEIILLITIIFLEVKRKSKMVFLMFCL